jgi:hypothetical protein
MLENPGKDGNIKSILSLKQHDLFMFTRKNNKSFTKEDGVGMQTARQGE